MIKTEQEKIDLAVSSYYGIKRQYLKVNPYSNKIKYYLKLSPITNELQDEFVNNQMKKLLAAISKEYFNNKMYLKSDYTLTTKGRAAKFTNNEVVIAGNSTDFILNLIGEKYKLRSIKRHFQIVEEEV
tara:strand:- start:176 stop:559 length:384 start_codon:yes stop_codon:yes gene_type:complete